MLIYVMIVQICNGVYFQLFFLEHYASYELFLKFRHGLFRSTAKIRTSTGVSQADTTGVRELLLDRDLVLFVYSK